MRQAMTGLIERLGTGDQINSGSRRPTSGGLFIGVERAEAVRPEGVHGISSNPATSTGGCSGTPSPASPLQTMTPSPSQKQVSEQGAFTGGTSTGLGAFGIWQHPHPGTFVGCGVVPWLVRSSPQAIGQNAATQRIRNHVVAVRNIIGKYIEQARYGQSTALIVP